nr:AAA family ATPase [Massilia sp. JS1662]
MFKKIKIENYKSIVDLEIELGRINIFIGENGAGKSNILEVIALAGAAASEKLDNEFLASRGIRVTKPEHMRTAFDREKENNPISIDVCDDTKQSLHIELQNDNSAYAKWRSEINIENFDLDFDAFKSTVDNYLDGIKAKTISKDDLSLNDVITMLEQLKSGLQKMAENPANTNPESLQLPPIALKRGSQFSHTLLQTSLKESNLASNLATFVIYSPENSALRTFEKEGQIEPLGINGEGLLKLLSFYSEPNNEDKETLLQIKDSMKLLSWFSDFKAANSMQERRLVITDRYLDEAVSDFDHKSTNEGFFFLLFYFTLFASKLTPPFFAIDNIDASLNPKLCRKLMSELTKLAEKNDKQAILTTHNPAILDGLNLDDDEQRLFVVSRTKKGTTKVTRVFKPQPLPGKEPQRLSSLFLTGMIGGLPKGF